jgi:hypothetical protein
MMSQQKWSLNRIIPSIAIGILVLGFLYQYQLAMRSAIQLARTKGFVNWRMDAVYRGADVTYGSAFAEFIRFLHDNLPEDTEVFLLPGTENSQVTDKYFMQYFLFPRHVRFCSLVEFPACPGAKNESRTIFIYSSGVPELYLDRYRVEKIEFDSQLGILVIVEASP